MAQPVFINNPIQIAREIKKDTKKVIEKKKQAELKKNQPKPKNSYKVSRKKNKSNLDIIIDYIFSEILYDYQVQWILDRARFKIYNKSRQIGISEAIALEALIFDVLEKKENVFFVSRSERQSIFLLDKFYKWVDIFIEAGVNIPITSRTKTECKINGVDVKSLTSKAVTGEGYSGNLYLDEFALHDDDVQLYASLFPIITKGYNMRIVSRPFGQSNMFYKIWNKEGGQFSDFVNHQTNVYDAVAAGCSIDVKATQNQNDDESFREQYECEFIDESTSFFPYNLLKGCLSDTLSETSPGNKFIGIDVGRTNDATSIIVLNLNSLGKYELIFKQEIKNKPFVEQRYIISEIIKKFNPIKVLGDKGAVGYQLLEDLEKDFNCVEGVSMSQDLKLQAFTNLKKLFEEKTIQIPDEIEFMSQIHSIKRTYSTNGKMSFTAERTSKGHSDSAFALALAVHATGKRKRNPSSMVFTKQW